MTARNHECVQERLHFAAAKVMAACTTCKGCQLCRQHGSMDTAFGQRWWPWSATEEVISCSIVRLCGLI